MHISLSTFWPGYVLLGLLLVILLHRPLKWLFQVLLRSAGGLLFLILWGQTGLLPGLALGANLFNALTLGILGLPGLGLLFLFRWIPLA